MIDQDAPPTVEEEAIFDEWIAHQNGWPNPFPSFVAGFRLGRLTNETETK